MGVEHPLRIVAVGEILWDVFPDGPRFGGAPANFACHAAELGAHVSLLSGVGRDRLGDDAIRSLESHGVVTTHVQRLEGFPTGTVQVTLDDRGHASYEFGVDEAWDHLAWNGRLSKLAAQTSAVCFGTLGQRSAASRETIQRFVKTTPTDAWRIFDINLRPPYWEKSIILESLAICNVLKLNDDELEVISGLIGLSTSANERLEELLERFELRVVALTKGDQGAILAEAGHLHHCLAVENDVVDTVGAGDSFTAALCVGLLRGLDLAKISAVACHVAAYVCSQPGGTPSLPESLRASLVPS